jgi:predicted RNase H-like HicB family nuclease
MVAELVFSFRKSPEGGYEAHAVGHPIFTQGDTMSELEANVKEAIACHFGDVKPLPIFTLVEEQPTRFRFGSAKGQFVVPDDFNDPMPEIEDLFYNGSVFPDENQ